MTSQETCHDWVIVTLASRITTSGRINNHIFYLEY